MTFSNEFASQGDPGFEESNYPTAFGITFTPKISGIALGILGAFIGIYVLTSLVMPANEEYQKLKTDERSKQDQVNAYKSGNIDRQLLDLNLKLQQAQALRTQVLALFSSQKALDTLLLDVNRVFQERNVKLLNFQPAQEAVVIDDGSLGAAVNNKLKRQTINLELEGGFEQTQAVLRDIERMQSLLLVKDLNSTTEGKQTGVLVQSNNNQIAVIPQGDNNLKTKFRLDVVLPLSPEEAAKLAPPPQEGQPQEGQPQ